MVIGAAGELPKPPAKPTVFLEGTSTKVKTFRCSYVAADMGDEELAEAVISAFHLATLF